MEEQGKEREVEEAGERSGRWKEHAESFGDAEKYRRRGLEGMCGVKELRVWGLAEGAGWWEVLGRSGQSWRKPHHRWPSSAFPMVSPEVNCWGHQAEGWCGSLWTCWYDVEVTGAACGS